MLKKELKKLAKLEKHIENNTDFEICNNGNYLYISFQGAGDISGGITEDFEIEISLDELRTVDDVITYIYDDAANYDIDEHAEMWINARYNSKRDNRYGIPPARRVVDEAETIYDCYEQLCDCVRRF